MHLKVSENYSKQCNNQSTTYIRPVSEMEAFNRNEKRNS